MTAIQEAATTWSIGVLATFAILIGMAWLDQEHSETGALQLSADISNERAAEFAALKGTK